MWSEHCSYKSSRHWLKQLPTEAPRVICGPGENAGVVDIGDGMAAVFKIESHNHPSYIEPYQGAATGVGGILRDVFTMGARPVALLELAALRRARAPENPPSGRRRGRRHRRLRQLRRRADGRRRGDLPPRLRRQHPGQRDVRRPRAPQDRIFYARAAGPGNPVIYVGSKTGRDGIHGATMASAEFAEEAEARRPTVQVGDPFTEKLLLEACLELMQTRRDRRHPGHGRGRPHLVVVRDGGARRRRHRARPRPRADPRGRHDALRDHALREPGADAAGAAPGRRGDGARDLRQVGPRRASRSAG